MAAAVGMMVDRAGAIWPTALAQIAIGAAVAVVTVAAGIMLAGSRQAVAATMVAPLASAVYWAASRYVARRYVLFPLVLMLLTTVYIGVTYASAIGVHFSVPGMSVATTPSTCHCVTDRIVSIQENAGDRDKLLARGDLGHTRARSPTRCSRDTSSAVSRSGSALTSLAPKACIEDP